MPKGFQKGRKKTGGNVKGSKHRSTEIRDYVKCEPIEKVIDLLENGDIKESEKAKIWMEVCKYFYKTPKNDINLEVNSAPQIVVATQADADLLKEIQNVKPDENVL